MGMVKINKNLAKITKLKKKKKKGRANKDGKGKLWRNLEISLFLFQSEVPRTKNMQYLYADMLK